MKLGLSWTIRDEVPGTDVRWCHQHQSITSQEPRFPWVGPGSPQKLTLPGFRKRTCDLANQWTQALATLIGSVLGKWPKPVQAK